MNAGAGLPGIVATLSGLRRTTRPRAAANRSRVAASSVAMRSPGLRPAKEWTTAPNARPAAWICRRLRALPHVR